MSTRVSRPAISKKLSCCVRPGVCDVRASALRPVNALRRLDLPTFERPANEISTPCMGGRLSMALAAHLKSAAPAKSLRPGSRNCSRSEGSAAAMGLYPGLRARVQGGGHPAGCGEERLCPAEPRDGCPRAF